MQTERFHTLDMLRGVAAITVMLFHAGYQAPMAIPRGYLAADLFFVLSGFVLAHSYEARLRDGMPVWTFVMARLRRIYPLFWLGALIGCLLFNGSPLMILMIPTEWGDGLLFRANAPLWSLLFELIVNLAWAFLAVRLRLVWLVVLLAGFGAVLAPAILAHDSADLGAFWQTAPQGLVRTLFSFTFGLVLFRLFRHRGSQRRTSALGWMLVPALVLPLAAFADHRALADLIMLGLGIPALVWLGARWEVRSPRLAGYLGGLSFPLYCIHAPFIAMAFFSPIAMAATCGAMIGCALLLDRFYDQPIQAWLKRRSQPACPAQEALA